MGGFKELEAVVPTLALHFLELILVRIKLKQGFLNKSGQLALIMGNCILDLRFQGGRKMDKKYSSIDASQS